MPAKKKRVKCLVCPNKAFSRGLCQSCLAAARLKIASGKTTEEQLIKKGLMSPMLPQGRPRKDSFDRAFSRK